MNHMKYAIYYQFIIEKARGSHVYKNKKKEKDRFVSQTKRKLPYKGLKVVMLTRMV